jgi:hypothetical protein
VAFPESRKPRRPTCEVTVETEYSSVAAIRAVITTPNWDVSRLPDDVTFNDLQPGMPCAVCDHRGDADIGPSWLLQG